VAAAVVLEVSEVPQSAKTEAEGTAVRGGAEAEGTAVRCQRKLEVPQRSPVPFATLGPCGALTRWPRPLWGPEGRGDLLGVGGRGGVWGLRRLQGSWEALPPKGGEGRRPSPPIIPGTLSTLYTRARARKKENRLFMDPFWSSKDSYLSEHLASQ
jgi:hypothetical protein